MDMNKGRLQPKKKAINKKKKGLMVKRKQQHSSFTKAHSKSTIESVLSTYQKSPQLFSSQDPSSLALPQINELAPYINQIADHIIMIDNKYFLAAQPLFQLQSHRQITTSMRVVLIQWLIKLGQRLKTKDQTIHICIQLIDYILIVKGDMINKGNFQLLGVSAFFLSSKLNQLHYPDSHQYLKYCDGQYTLEELFQMQSIILAVTEFNLQIPTIIQFVYNLALVSELPSDSQNLIKVISNLCLFDFNLFNKYKKNHIALVIVYFIAKILGVSTDKSKSLIYQVGMTSSTFKECLTNLVNLYKESENYLNKR